LRILASPRSALIENLPRRPRFIVATAACTCGSSDSGGLRYAIATCRAPAASALASWTVLRSEPPTCSELSRNTRLWFSSERFTPGTGWSSPTDEQVKPKLMRSHEPLSNRYTVETERICCRDIDTTKPCHAAHEPCLTHQLQRLRSD